MPADLAQRIAIALECGVIWTKDTEAHQRMQRALADFNEWRTCGVAETRAEVVSPQPPMAGKDTK